MNISIETAQNVSITYKPAGLLPRMIATLIDICLTTGILLLCTLSFSMVTSQVRGIIMIVAVILLTCYPLFFEYFLNGQTIGKLTLNLRVVRLDGQKLTFWNCLLRWVIGLVDIVATMGIAAILTIIISSKMQRLGDLAAGTTVILENKQSSYIRLATDELPEEHQVIFPQVTLLSDKDISIIKAVYKEVQQTEANKLLEPLALKVKELTGIQTDLNHKEFIQTIIQDYTELTK